MRNTEYHWCQQCGWLCENYNQRNTDYNWCQQCKWIEYDKFEDVEYLAKGGFGTTFKAVWKDGPISGCDYDNNQWERNGKTKVALKCLHNSQDITADFLKEIESNILVSSGWVVRCFDIHNKGLIHHDFHCGNILSDFGDFAFITDLGLCQPANIEHSQTVYTSRLLDFKNLPEPKNADNNDLEYSDSLKMDFTKIDINSKDERN
ncbi:unnamed protein product [Rhizophagus irregularis]|nr:unnamed protein product [Rhizophagus irregularis]